MKKRILSILLTLCMILCLVPTGVFAEGEASEGSAAIQLGTSSISNPTKATEDDEGDYWVPNSYIYFGVNGANSNTPIKWRVLDADKANDGTTDGMFLLSEYLLASGVKFNDISNENNYQGSAAQTWCNTFVTDVNNFSLVEQIAMFGVAKADSAEDGLYALDWDASSLTESDKMFFLSVRELADYVGNYDGAPGMAATDAEGNQGSWWLRSPWVQDYYHGGPVYEQGHVNYQFVDYECSSRPAVNVNTNDVLFTSAAEGGKRDGFNAVPEYTGNEWKLTLLDSSRSFNAFTNTTKVKVGEKLSVTYSGAGTGENEYVSAMIVDSSDNILYYGRIARNRVSGTVDVAIPSDLADGNYTLKVFSEQYNGDYKTDYASEFQNISFTLKSKIDEQFTLTPGGRYYFDLSAMDIPGTVNSSLPDATLHYVPFTYVGTVDAYVLKPASNGVADSSEQASVTADKDAQYGYTYEHSLFIADYKVTDKISWIDLNNAGFIFGKAYTAGGISYTLRTPTMGSSANDGNNSIGVPGNNEWDKILAKNPNFIKAMGDKYEITQFWGQDTCDYYAHDKTKVTRNTANNFMPTVENTPNNGVCYRPVLELPTDLAAGSLKAVELITDGRMPGETYQSINIIVKNGESFKAPSAEGLPLSANTAADTPMWWVDENLNFYKPGDTVPASVSKLTAFYGGFGLLLDRGDGAVEVTPDNYTDIFGDGTASFVVPKGESLESIAESGGLTATEQREILTTGCLGENIFPNLQLKNADLTSVTLNDRYIGQNSPLFITLDGKNTIGSLNEINRASFLSILGDGALTLNNALTLSQYAQYGGSSVTMAGGLNVYNISVGSGSLTVTGDTQAITFRDQYISDLYMGDGVRLFLGSSAQDAVEAAIPQLSAEMQEVFQRYQADDPTLTREEYSALSKALKEQFDAILPLFSGKTYVRIVGAWDVTYQPGTNGTGDIATDVKFYGDALTLKGKLFTRTGYTQIGWATIDGGEKIYGLDAVYTQNEALTLYPVWNANQYTITFDTAGGSKIDSITQDYGTTITAPANPTREGYTFIGWDKEIPKTMPAENITITAQWAACDHSGSTAQPTCIDSATCTDCGGTIAALGHAAKTGYKSDENSHWMECERCTAKLSEEPHRGGEANCHAKAVCETCNTPYGDLDAENHDGGKAIRDRVPATCTEDGYSGDTYCLGCDTLLATGKKIKAEGHKGGKATCTEKAKCEVCNEKYGEPDPSNHSDTTEWIQTESEHTQQYRCCGAVVVQTEEHNWKDGICRKCGYGCEHIGGKATCHTKAICKTCNLEYGEFDGDNHDGETELRGDIAATCTENGYTGDTYCLGCDKVLATGKEIKAKGHKGGKATCHTKAVCKICKTEYGKLDKDNHDGETELRGDIAATCTENGYTGDTYCLGCDKVLATGKEIKAKGHKGGKATCHTKAVCKICKTEYGKLDKDNHDGETELRGDIAATCTENGYTGDTYCLGCDKVLATGKEIKAKGHKGGKATCHTKAVCDICGKGYGKLDPKNHADLKHIDAKPATTKSEGNIEYRYCKGCKKYYKDAAGTKEIRLSDTVIAKIPSDSKNPKTDAHSNFDLWFILMFIGGGVWTGVTVVSKKKKHFLR